MFYKRLLKGCLARDLRVNNSKLEKERKIRVNKKNIFFSNLNLNLAHCAFLISVFCNGVTGYLTAGNDVTSPEKKSSNQVLKINFNFNLFPV